VSGHPQPPRFVVLVGNPKPQSRSLTVATTAAEAISRSLGIERHELVDLCRVAEALPSSDQDVVDALETVASADLLLVASPTFKGTYSGLLKTFLDLLPYRGLERTVALPLLVMNSAQHSLAVEVHLRPLLVELGASVPTSGLALLESELPRLDAVLDAWVARAADQLAAALASPNPTPIRLGA
jgi:FMN reductase